MPARIGATSIILFVVAGTVLQSAFEVTDPVLMALPALNRKWTRHLPVLLVMMIILVIPVFMLHTILSKVSSDMWILVVVSSYVVTIVQVVGSLATYSLFMWDSYQPEPSQHMDDYVFYIKAVTKTCEFLMALSIVSGGVYEIMMNEDELSLINIGILVIHFYFNVYQRITSGWKTFMARRETKKRLSVLEDATAQDLEDHQDVCSICYQDMTTAKKTKCGHIFHQNCLKRWLFVQDNCPMCTAPIIEVPKPQSPPPDLQAPQPDNLQPDLNEGHVLGSAQPFATIEETASAHLESPAEDVSNVKAEEIATREVMDHISNSHPKDFDLNDSSLIAQNNVFNGQEHVNESESGSCNDDIEAVEDLINANKSDFQNKLESQEITKSITTDYSGDTNTTNAELPEAEGLRRRRGSQPDLQQLN